MTKQEIDGLKAGDVLAVHDARGGPMAWRRFRVHAVLSRGCGGSGLEFVVLSLNDVEPNAIDLVAFEGDQKVVKLPDACRDEPIIDDAGEGGAE